jgi:hypothetical protein
VAEQQDGQVLMTRYRPRALAVCRILFGLAALMNAVEIHAILSRVDEGAMSSPGPLPFALTASAISLWTVVASSSALMVCLGILTGPAALTASACCLFAMLWDQQAYTNHFWLTTLLLGYLAFARSDAQWSVRSAVRGRLDAVPQVPAFLMVTQLSICYLFAALSKVNPWWITGDELRSSLQPTLPDALYAPLAIAVVLTELVIACGMWFRHTRVWALLAGVSLHVSIVALMDGRFPLVTFSIVCLAVYPLVVRSPYAPELVRHLRQPDERVATSPHPA